MIQPRKGWTTPGSTRNVPPKCSLTKLPGVRSLMGVPQTPPKASRRLTAPARRRAPDCQSPASSFFISAISAAWSVTILRLSSTAFASLPSRLSVRAVVSAPS